MSAPPESLNANSRRIDLVDALRGVALVAMAVYHFTWDLEFFDFAEAGLTAQGGWKWFARSIAGSFLLLAGASLFLAHGQGLRREAFFKRLAQVAGAALAITLVTRFAFPDSFIYFGILHQIAFASVVGLAFLRLPIWATLATTALLLVLPHVVHSSAFDPRWLAWTGLAERVPRSNDFVPVVPWTGVVLAGLGLAQMLLSPSARSRLAALGLPRAGRPLAFAGRHSLAVYLIHQPVLIGLVWIAAQLLEPAGATPEARFLSACARTCATVREKDFCDLYCVCALDGLSASGHLAAMFSPEPDAEAKAEMERLAGQCTGAADAALTEKTP